MRPIALLLFLLAGCVVRPEGEQPERDRAAAAGAAFRKPFGEREVPAIEPDSPLPVYLANAEANHGALEAAWQRWIAALERVPMESTQPTTAMVGVEHTLDGGDALDRTVFQLMSDAMNNVLWPGRLADQGEAALAEAKVAAAAFDRQRLRLQTQVAEAFHALALRDEELRLLGRLRAVLAVQVPSLQAQVRAGSAGQRELLLAQAALDRLDAEHAALQQGRPALHAALRALVGGGPDFPDVHPALAGLLPVRPTEQDYVEQALTRNPELQEARAEAAARLSAIAVAEWERMPAFSLKGEIMGDGAQLLGAAFSLPWLRGTAIEAGVRKAQAEAAAAEALRRQAGADAVASIVAELALLSAAEQEAAVLGDRLLPKLRQAADVAKAAWAAGGGGFASYAEALAMAIEVERALLRLRAEHAVARARAQEALGGAEVASE